LARLATIEIYQVQRGRPVDGPKESKARGDWMLQHRSRAGGRIRQATRLRGRGRIAVPGGRAACIVVAVGLGDDEGKSRLARAWRADDFVQIEVVDGGGGHG